MTSIEIAMHYFKLSNESNFEEIERMFSENATFRSGKGELFLGSQEIMAMQRAHHRMYKKLEWVVKEVREVKPGIVHFDFDFDGVSQEDKNVKYSGVEDVIIYNKKIQHVQVQLLNNKTC